MVLLVITILKNEACTNGQNVNCENLLVLNENKKVELNDKQYSIAESKVGFKVTILDEPSLQQIKVMDSPVIYICFNNEKLESKGNPIFSSSIPPGVKSFYPLSVDNKISFSNGNQVLITLVSKVTR